MRKSFAPLDDILIERLFQPVANFAANRAGFGRGAMACFCLDAASVAWIVSRVQDLTTAVTDENASTATIDIAILLLGLVAMVSLRTLFRRTEGRRDNPLRVAMQPHRAVVLLMLLARIAQPSGASLADMADLTMLLCATAALYIGACAAPPPLPRAWEAIVSPT